MLFYTFTFPITSLANSKEFETEIQLGIIVIPENVEEVPLYEFEEIDENSEGIAHLQNEDEVIILKELESMTLVELINVEETQEHDEEIDIISGYVQNEFIEAMTLDGESDVGEEDIPKNDDSIIDEEVSPENEEDMIDEDPDFEGEQELENDSGENDTDDKSDEESDDSLEEKSEETISPSNQMFSSMQVASNPIISGVALKEKTAVYSNQSRSSSILKSYSSGTILKYRALNSNWYAATVYINGKATSGFIHTSDVDGLVPESGALRGVALKSPTHVYVSPSTSGKIQKSYAKDSILAYRALSNDWYITGVYINGKKETGYIHKSHVENTLPESERVSLRGIALNSPTNVYTSTSTSAKVHRSYAQGSLLAFSTFSKDWYITGVYINGKRETGYIHKSHVENTLPESERVSLRGIALNSPTNVYTSTSTSAKVHRSYAQGSLLAFSTFSKDWYITGVYINGKRETGYIHKSHVENTLPESERVSLRGIALNSPTNVYTSTSTSAKVHRSYAQGSLLAFSTFSKDWYITGVYINGKRETGYIHKSHVENTLPESERVSLRGIALNSPTNVYTSTSTGAKVHRSYVQGSLLAFSTFSKDWYITGVYINGKRETGYIHKSHVENAVNNYDLVVKYAKKQSTNIYTIASTSSNVIKTYGLNSKLTIRTFTSDWYEARVFVNGEPIIGYIHKDDLSDKIIDTTIPSKYDYSFRSLVDDQFKREILPNKDGGGSTISTRGEVEFFTNPLNFPEGTSSHFQFLILNESAGLNPTELNNTVLKGKGILSGQGKAFVDAGRQNNMNEAYLIAHALLETGNGTSTLASGIWVDEFGTITRKDGKLAKTPKSKHIVYNVYGYGAKNACPLDCGAKTAFDEGWFTPSEAIIGGSNKIEIGYIGNGLNTLYKMRWNPANRGHWRQYATHTKWAYLQTSRIASIYNQLNDYTLRFDVPSFKDMPNYDTGAAAQITGSSVNFRTGPGTTNSIITRLAINTDVTIIGSTVVGSEGWYQIKVNGTTGWVAADYVVLTY